jgi:hypothetical protein
MLTPSATCSVTLCTDKDIQIAELLQKRKQQQKQGTMMQLQKFLMQFPVLAI